MAVRRLAVHAACLTLLALLAPASVLSAQSGDYPGLTASFVIRTGTAGPTDPIPVWVRLTLAPDAEAFRFDAAARTTNYGLPAGFLPTTGRRLDGTTGTFATYQALQTTVGFGCPNTFGPPADVSPPVSAPGCGAPLYRFATNTTGTAGGVAGPSFHFRSAFMLQPGASFDFLFGTFLPQGAGAPPGVYEFRSAVAALNVTGVDAAGQRLMASAPLARTCPPGDASDCAFTRTVAGAAVVPEPRSVVLLAAGAAGLALGTLRARRRDATA